MDININRCMDKALLLSEAYASAYEYMHDIKILMNNAKSIDDVAYKIGLQATMAIIEYLSTLQITD